MKKKSTAAILTLAALLSLALLFSSCSARSGNLSDEKGYSSPSYSSRTSPEAADYSLGEAGGAPTELKEGQKLIRTCRIDAETKEFDSAVSAIKARAAELGGYIESEQLYNGSDRYYSSKYAGRGTDRTLSAVFRIPQDKLQQFTDGIAGAVSVTGLSTTSSDVTDEYIDIEARLETLKTERQSLLQMMASINTTKDYEFWYQLHIRVTELENEIASYEASVRNIDSKVSYSSVSLNLAEVVEYTTEEPGFFARIGQAFTDSWKDFAGGCADLAVWFVEAIPTLLVIAGITVAVVFIIRSIVRKSRRKRSGQVPPSGGA
jgi:hypothetical protein